MFRRFLVAALIIAVGAAAAAPAPSYGWQLHHADWGRIERTIQRACDYGVTEIRLSHNIIRAIDQINDDPAVERIVRDTCRLAHEHDMKVYVWAKELNIGDGYNDVCLDPDGGGKGMWDARRAAYEAAFARVPDLDGITLQFGSCPTEVWHVRNDACDFNENTPNDERVAMTIRIVKEVCDANGVAMDVRTFNHSPDQLEWIRKAIASVPGVRAMIKEVPQDWQPYYPVNPAIGRVGPNSSTIEIDLAAEYQGRSHILYCMTDYLAWRMKALRARGMAGVVVRVACSADTVLDTPNEVNLYAMQRLLEGPDVSADAIWRDWIQKRYGLAPDTEASRRLIAALRRSYPIGRKMYYILGHWALEKSSDIPEELRARCLDAKNLPQWEPAFTASYEALLKPSDAMLSRIWHEKGEAVALAAQSLDDLEAAADALSPEDYEGLSKRMRLQHKCTRVWRYVADVVCRWLRYREDKGEEDGRIIENDLRALEDLAGEMEPTAPIANPQRIRAFVADVRAKFPPCDNPLAFEPVLPADASPADLTPVADGTHWLPVEVSVPAADTAAP